MRKRIVLFTGLVGLILLLGCKNKTSQAGDIVSVTSTPAAIAEVVSSPAPTATPTTEPTPTPSPTPEPTALPVLPELPNPVGLLGQKYKERFTHEVVYTDTSYTSPTISLSWEEIYDTETFGKPVTYFVVDIYVQDVKQVKTTFARNGRFSPILYGTLEDISESVNAVVAISGDYAAWRKKGLVIRNGEVIRTTLDNTRDVGVLYADGTFACYEVNEVPLEEILSNDPWQSWCFGPSLLTAEGETKTKFNSGVTKTNPRAAFGYYEPGHYCFVLVDGRAGSYSRGVTMSELSQIMYSLGCTVAVNLDGGATARLSWNHQVINRPSKVRYLHDIIYVGEYEE